jgi:hypothetical protein
MGSLLTSFRKRLLDHQELTVEPFVRAAAVTDCSVYWCGVGQFPMDAYERAWLLEFLRRLAERLKATDGLREETFLQAKAVLPDLMDIYLKRSRTYMPFTGMTLTPGTAPAKPPSADEMRKELEKAGKNNSSADVAGWMPDYSHHFLDKSAEAQREDFFGHGGMFSLLMAPDAKPRLTLPTVSRLMQTHPAYTGGWQKQYDTLQSIQNDWLKQSKEIFGEPFRDDASYDGLPFILPLLTAKSVMDASPETREKWFGLFDGYWIESKPDNGLLLVLKNADFDQDLQQLLEEMRADGHAYRSTR